VRIFPTQLSSNDCSVFHLTQCIHLHYLGKADQAKYVLKYTENLKNIPNIINRNLYKDQQILIIFGKTISDLGGY